MSDNPVLTALARLEEGLLRFRVDVMQRLDGQGDWLTKIEADQT